MPVPVARPDERPASPSVRPAATVMVVRDGPDPSAPLEVLMVRRSLRSAFVGGAHVFPGGAVDPQDGSPRASARCQGLDDEAASRRLGVERGGLAYWVAAIRECFEEAGVILAVDGDGHPVPVAGGGRAERLARHRHELNAGRRGFVEICEAEGLWLAAGRLSYVAHWITPEGAPRRYDTRFFVAEAPPDQVPAHDAGETIADTWLRPADALAAQRAGTIDLVLPTVRMLEMLARHARVGELLDALASQAAVPAVLPRLVAAADGGRRLLLPGDPGYDDGAPQSTGGRA